VPETGSCRGFSLLAAYIFERASQARSKHVTLKPSSRRTESLVAFFNLPCNASEALLSENHSLCSGQMPRGPAWKHTKTPTFLGFKRESRCVLHTLLKFTSQKTIHTNQKIFRLSCTIEIWLILPVVICLFQGLSHACLRITALQESAHGSLHQTQSAAKLLRFTASIGYPGETRG